MRPAQGLPCGLRTAHAVSSERRHAFARHGRYSSHTVLLCLPAPLAARQRAVEHAFLPTRGSRCAPRAAQTCRFATGIDTGCVLGDCLTAVVLPSVPDLAARGFRPAAALAAGGEGVTLAALGAELVSVPAARNYAGSDKD